MSDKPHEHEGSGPYYATYPPPDNQASIVLCLDSNVFVRHGFSIELLESIKAFCHLFTICGVIVPEVVLKECERVYAQGSARLKGSRPSELKEQLSRLEKHIGRLFEDHFAEWRKKLEQVADILPTTDSLLRTAYERLMAKKPPCHNRDETRDAIIWETVLAARCPPHKKQIRVFVTHNTRDFPFESHPQLQAETKEAGILWFKTFADLQRWVAPLRPTPWRKGIEFATWYEEQDFSWQTAGRLQDELPDYLMDLCEHFDSDAEVFDMDKTHREITSEETAADGTREFVITEEWEISVSYGVSADVRIGGSDGVDFGVSGWRQTSGSATLERTLRFDPQRNLIANEVEVEELDLSEDDEEWDPHEAWVESLAEDRDDA
jgi:predicted nucleic acid-binding protein